MPTDPRMTNAQLAESNKELSANVRQAFEVFGLANDFNFEILARDVHAIKLALSQRLSFGEPQDPSDPDSSTLAGGAGVSDHNGTLNHINGSWAQQSVTGFNVATTFTHNLDVPFVSSSTPNVIWFVSRLSHDGTGVGTDSVITCNYDSRDTVDRNSIQLRLYGQTRTLTGHPVEATLFFMPVTR